MSKIDTLKEQKSDYKEIFKALIYLIVLLFTGIITVAYNVLIHKIDTYLIVLSGIGLVVVFLISLYAIKLWNKMQELNKEMENV
jgi:amino acid permease